MPARPQVFGSRVAAHAVRADEQVGAPVLDRERTIEQVTERQRLLAGNRQRLERTFHRLADVHDAVARRDSGRERQHEIDVRVQRARGTAVDANTATRARRVSRRGQPALAVHQQIDEQEFVLELARQVEQEFQDFHRLQLSEDRRHRAEDARFGAVADQAVAGRFRPLATQAGAATVCAHDLQLSLVLVHACEHCGHAGTQGGIVDDELGGEVVAAVDDHIGRGKQLGADGGVETPRHWL